MSSSVEVWTRMEQTKRPTLTVDAHHGCCSPEHSDSYAADKAKLLARLKRIEGQVRGIGRMVEDDRYCIDILTQISAVISSTQSVGLVMLQDHIRGCVVNAQSDEREARLEELDKAIERFTRSIG